MNRPPGRRVTIGQAVLASQYIKAFFIFAALYLIFNPYMIPFNPLRLGVQKVHDMAHLLLGGPWYLIVGKLFALVFCIYSAYVVMNTQKEKLEMRNEAQREDEIRARMRKARNASQQRLNELIEEEERKQQEANDAAMADQIVRKEGVEEDALAKGVDFDKARGQLVSRVHNETLSAAAIVEVEQRMKSQAAAAKINEKSTSAAPVKSLFVDKLQSELDQVSAQSSPPPSIKPQADQAKQDDLRGKAKDSFVDKLQSELDQALASEKAPPPPSVKAQGDKIKQEDLKAKKKDSFVEKMQTELNRASATQRASPSAAPQAGTTSRMVSLSEAREAEERQRVWLQQLSDQVTDGPARARAATLEAERKLREEQEEEYRNSLAADEARKREFERERQEAELKKAREKEVEEAARISREALVEMRKKALADLPEEPAVEEGGGLVVVRVRVLKGAVHQRRFLASSSVAEVLHWVGLMDEVPEEEGKWRLVTSFPRSEPQREATVSDVACGAGAVALFVEEI